jgi:hypothetical protein
MHIGGLPLKFRFAGAGALAIAVCLALSPALIKKSKAFTLIEMEIFFAPELIGLNQSAEVALNNTFGSGTIRATINWGDAVSGAAIGAPSVQDLAPGHGAVVALPAVQSGNNSQMVVIARVTLTGTNGAALPRGIQGQLGAALHVFDKNTHQITVSQLPYLLPAVQ